MHHIFGSVQGAGEVVRQSENGFAVRLEEGAKRLGLAAGGSGQKLSFAFARHPADLLFRETAEKIRGRVKCFRILAPARCAAAPAARW